MQTPDTTAAIKAIMPMADALGITVSVSNDGNKLICDYNIICIGGNSTFATIMEFVGYVFIRYWMRNYSIRFRYKRTEEDVGHAIYRYWLTEDKR